MGTYQACDKIFYFFIFKKDLSLRVYGCNVLGIFFFSRAGWVCPGGSMALLVCGAYLNELNEGFWIRVRVIRKLLLVVVVVGRYLPCFCSLVAFGCSIHSVSRIHGEAAVTYLSDSRFCNYCLPLNLFPACCVFLSLFAQLTGAARTYIMGWACASSLS
jgi:hypothetical protein